jgi:hypothetical protein
VRVRSASLTAVLTAALTCTASVASSLPVHDVSSVAAPTPAASPGDLAVALRSATPEEAAIATLAAAGGDADVLRAMAEGSIAEHLLSIPDIDADGRDDVLGLARTPRPAQSEAGAAEQMVVTARRGVDGAAVWSSQVPGSMGIVVPDGDDLLVVSSEVTQTIVSMTLTAFAPDGDVRWSRTDRGALTGTAFVNLPVYQGPMEGPEGRRQHLLLLWDIVVATTSTTPSRATAVVLDAAAGSTVGTVVGSSNDQVTFAHAIGDVDGNGQDDVGITRSAAFGSRGTITAHGVDGAELWQVAAPFRSNGYLDVSGDATGDGKADIAIGFDTGTVALIDGGRGEIAWEKDGNVPAVLGDVDGDGLDDIGVRTLGGGPQTLELEHAAFTGSGRQLYRTERVVSHDYIEFTSTTTTFLDAADVDGDGIRDTGHSYVVRPTSGPSVFDGGPTSGATGQQLWTSEDAETPQRLDGRLAGRAADYIRVRQGGSGAFVEAFDGTDGTVQWARIVLRTPSQFATSSATVADVNGDGIGDVLLTLFSSAPTTGAVQTGFVVDGRDGTTLWSVA